MKYFYNFYNLMDIYMNVYKDSLQEYSIQVFEMRIQVENSFSVF